MSVFSGAGELSAIKLGGSDITAVYSGAEKVWPEESAATVLKITARPSHDRYAAIPYEVTDKTEAPQWRTWMRVEDSSSAAVNGHTEFTIEEIPADAEIKFLVVGKGGTGRGEIKGFAAGGGGEVIEWSLGSGGLKAGDKFRMGRIKWNNEPKMRFYLEIYPQGGEPYYAAMPNTGGDGYRSNGGSGWVDGQEVPSPNTGGSGAAGVSPGPNGADGVYLNDWGETFGAGGYAGDGQVKEMGIGCGGFGVRGGSAADQNNSGEEGGVALQADCPIEMTIIPYERPFRRVLKNVKEALNYNG